MTKHLIIANPTAGKGTAEQAIFQVERMLNEHGLDFDIVHTDQPWHAAELARDAAAAGYDVAVAMGGDGTANEVLNGLMMAKQAGETPCAMGILCAGRGNDFAYGMGVPTDLETGCKALALGKRHTVDVGHVIGGLYPQGRYFGNGIGVGFDAVVGFEAAKFAHLGGFLGYLVAVLKTVFLYHKAPMATIEYDEETIEQSSLMISIMNGRRMGGGFMMAPEGRPDDGLFDLCIARQVSRPRIFTLIPHFIKGTQATQEPIKSGRTKRIVVTAIDGALPAHADGETLCVEGQRLEIELVPGQIEIICQPAGERP
jgi:YegS/Rv2252/BmrU family lipid kinase